MPSPIILLSGSVSAGKTTLAELLEQRFGFQIIKTGHLLQESLNSQGVLNRRNLQEEGERLDRSTQGTWVKDLLDRELQRHPSDAKVILDSVRILPQVDAIRRSYGGVVVHVHLTAPVKALSSRYMARQGKNIQELSSYEEVRANQTEKDVENLADSADIVVDTNRCTREDVLVQVASRLRLFGDHHARLVDVIVGGQYGSEGKGQISAHLAPEYDLLVRVGGPNAGHSVYSEPEPYKHHQLPSGTTRTDAKLLIAPGALINVPNLLSEMADCQVGADRLAIDPQVMIISEEDKRSEETLGELIGSTRQGVGAAAAQRIMGRGGNTRLARDIPELKQYIRPAAEVFEDTFSRNQKTLVEGTQGSALSLYHGNYPFVTSRDTTVSGCLADSGIPPHRLRKVVMVCRTYPIRVESPQGASSGPMSLEISWDEVGRRSGLDPKILEEAERTTTTGRLRRVGEFDWGLLRKAAMLNGPTDIALTFVDYLNSENRKARRFEQLDEQTIRFVEEVESVAAAPVSLVSTRFHWRGIIDRRTW